MPKTIWWALLGMMVAALMLHLDARAQRRRAGRPVPGHETGGLLATLAMILLIVSDLLNVETLLAQLFIGSSVLLTLVAFWFVVRHFRCLSRHAA